MLAFSNDDEQARRELEAARALTMRHLARGIQEPLRPEEVQEHVRSSAVLGGEVSDGRMGAGEPELVVGGLLELDEAARPPGRQLHRDRPGLSQRGLV